MGEDSHREEGKRKSEKEGRDAAWGPKQETGDIDKYMYAGGGAGRYERRNGGGRPFEYESKK